MTSQFGRAIHRDLPGARLVVERDAGLRPGVAVVLCAERLLPCQRARRESRRIRLRAAEIRSASYDLSVFPCSRTRPLRIQDRFFLTQSLGLGRDRFLLLADFVQAAR